MFNMNKDFLKRIKIASELIKIAKQLDYFCSLRYNINKHKPSLLANGL